MKVTDDMGRLVPAKVQKAVDNLLEKSDKPENPEIAELKEKIASIEAKLFGAVEKIDERISEAEEKLKKGCTPGEYMDIINGKSPADVNNDGKVDEKDLSVVHKEYAKAKKSRKKE